MSASPHDDTKAEHGEGRTADLISRIAQLGNHERGDVVARMLAGLDKHEREELDRLLAKLIRGLSAG